MRVMITTTAQPDTLATYYTKYLSQIKSIEVKPVYTFDLEDDLIGRGMVYKIGAHMLPGIIARKVSALLRKEISIWKPDVLIIIKGQFIHPGFLAYIKQSGIYLVNYNPDHPLSFESRASGNSYIRESVPIYNLLFTYSPIIRDEIAKRFPKLQTSVLPFGYEESSYTDNPILVGSIIQRICFAGTADRNRADFLRELLVEKRQVDVYGGGYDKYLGRGYKNLNLFPGVSGDLYLEKLQQYSISLNLYRKQNVGSHNMRSFEIPAVGGIQLVEYSDQMNELFKDQETVFFYRNEREMRGQVEDLLNMPDEELVQIKENVRRKTLMSGYSYANRAQEMINTIMTII